MKCKDKTQVKLFLTPEAHALLIRNKEVTGVSMSLAVEDLVKDVLAGELAEAEAKKKK
jgi:hypothetical protein